MKNLVIVLFTLLISVNFGFGQVNVQFSQNNQFEAWNDSVFNSDGYYCNTNLLAYHDFSLANGDSITKWVWIFEGATNYDTLEMTPNNYQMHIWVYYPNIPGSYQTTLTVYAFNSANVEYFSSVTVTVHIGLASIFGGDYYEVTPDDSVTLSSYSSSGPGHFIWSKDGVFIQESFNSNSSYLTVNEVGEYMVTYINDQSGCETFDFNYVDWVWPGSVCAMFGTDDSLSLGGGYFCNQASITFYDLSSVYSTAQLYHWTWRVKTGDGNTVLQEIVFNQANYQPSITIQFADSTAYYRVELAVSSYSPGTSTLNVGLHLGFSDVSASPDVTIAPGDSVTLSAYTNYGPGNFLWYKDGFLGFTSNANVSYLSVADSGMYLVNYHGNGCESWDSVMVKWADPMPAPVASFSVNSPNYAPVAYFCNTIQVYCYNHSICSNITKSVWVITQQNQTSSITLTGPNALDYITVNLIPGNDHVDLVKLFVYSFDGNYNVELVDSIETQLVMGFSDIVVSDPVVELTAGSTASLHAYTTFGPGTFIWTNQSGDTLAVTSNAIQSNLLVSDTGVYWVKFVNVLGNCENIASIKVIYAITTNLSELTHANTQVYPNPTFERFTVDNFSGKVEIFSATGQLIFSQTVSEKTSILCQDWKPGFYFIRLKTLSGETETVKLVKQ
ncbi:MAG: T9SS type A sorting domain-containing protein [Patescibacteria group bacterium]